MKKFFLFAVVATMVVRANALVYSEARDEAWFLTDKMAYELSLTDEQISRAYEINLDYFLNVSTPADIYGVYWQYRNEDLSYVLFDWQYNMYVTRQYFYRPFVSVSGRLYMPLWRHYDRNRFYYSRPLVVNVYRGRLGVERGPRGPYYGYRRGPQPPRPAYGRPRPPRPFDDGDDFRRSGRTRPDYRPNGSNRHSNTDAFGRPSRGETRPQSDVRRGDDNSRQGFGSQNFGRGQGQRGDVPSATREGRPNVGNAGASRGSQHGSFGGNSRNNSAPRQAFARPSSRSGAGKPAQTPASSPRFGGSRSR